MTKALKISSIRRKYKDEWVAAAVTRRDKSLVPVAGKVLIHDSDREKVYDYGFQLQKQNPSLELYFFFTGEPVPEGMEVILGAI
jgi:hypothetical protein